jgi:HK97 family phage prohead protease
MAETALWSGIQLRAADSDGRTLTGIAVPYSQPTDLVAGGPEVFDPGAMTRTAQHWAAASKRLKVLRGHDMAAPCGHVTALDDTPDGLTVEIRLADTQHGRQVVEEVAEGTLDALSVGFRAIRHRVIDGVRHILEAQLLELSLVAVPAYPGAVLTGVRESGPAPQLPPLPPIPTIPARLLQNPRILS